MNEWMNEWNYLKNVIKTFSDALRVSNNVFIKQNLKCFLKYVLGLLSPNKTRSTYFSTAFKDIFNLVKEAQEYPKEVNYLY